MAVFFLRHGETTHNVMKVHCGGDSNFGTLTNHGRAQMKWAGQYCQRYNFDYMSCSKLERAKESMKIFIEQQMQSPHLVKYLHILRERDLGKLNGYPESYKITPREELESEQEFEERVIPWVKRLDQYHGAALVLTSSGVIGQVKKMLGDKSPTPNGSMWRLSSNEISMVFTPKIKINRISFQ